MLVNYSETQIQVLEKPRLTCDDVELLFGDYVDGDLPSSVKDRVDGHLHACPHCQQFAAGYKQVVSLAKSLPDRVIPLGVQNRLRERLNQRLGLKLAITV